MIFSHLGVTEGTNEAGGVVAVSADRRSCTQSQHYLWRPVDFGIPAISSPFLKFGVWRKATQVVGGGVVHLSRPPSSQSSEG